ncbi:mitogen-activated protein kinase 15-like isoform X2 [Cimex lectularius]|uniref:Protein kinase domain-containing protein n=1 Tax=Cimex lectularius TaxID=79782 RepID=A0A8I6TBV6_CIMLE|nr:mitogen-activated protein kinase 15-like isoform X2 [Cimex lectularius]
MSSSKKLARGFFQSYGIVWKAFHRTRARLVAIKIIEKAFSADSDAQMAFREIGYLTALRRHRNIVKLLAVHPAWNDKDLYLVFEHMDLDLRAYMDRGHLLTDPQVSFISYQILSALRYIHSANIVHRDLKPANILLGARCEVRIADFGLARSLEDRGTVENGSPLTKYVATRWYRAPELLLNGKKYTTSVDIWSLGCIIAEMHNGVPLFPGTTTIHQLELILTAIPMTSYEEFGLDPDGIGSRLAGWNSGKFPELDRKIEELPKDGQKIVKLMLDPSPTRRISADAALVKNYFSRYFTGREPALEGVRLMLSDSELHAADAYKNAIYAAIECGRSFQKNGLHQRTFQSRISSRIV